LIMAEAFEVKAVARHIPISAQKVRLVLDAIRGKGAAEALGVLRFMPNKAAEPVYKLVYSAAANAERLGRIAQQLLDRYGLVTREVAAAEGIEGGFGTIYDVFRAMEDAGRIRRGYFVTGISTLQFAQPAMLDLLRSQRQRGDEPQAVLLSATDPACPYGTLLPWPRPAVDDANRKLTRSTGAVVVCVDGELVAYVSKSGRRVWMAHIGDEHWRELAWKLAASELATRARRLGSRRSTHLMFNEIDGQAAHAHPFAAALLSAGFRPIGDGLKGPTGEYDG